MTRYLINAEGETRWGRIRRVGLYVLMFLLATIYFTLFFYYGTETLDSERPGGKVADQGVYRTGPNRPL